MSNTCKSHKLLLQSVCYCCIKGYVKTKENILTQSRNKSWGFSVQSGGETNHSWVFSDGIVAKNKERSVKEIKKVHGLLFNQLLKLQVQQYLQQTAVNTAVEVSCSILGTKTV